MKKKGITNKAKKGGSTVQAKKGDMTSPPATGSSSDSGGNKNAD